MDDREVIHLSVLYSLSGPGSWHFEMHSLSVCQKTGTSPIFFFASIPFLMRAMNFCWHNPNPQCFCWWIIVNPRKQINKKPKENCKSISYRAECSLKSDSPSSDAHLDGMRLYTSSQWRLAFERRALRTSILKYLYCWKSSPDFVIRGVFELFELPLIITIVMSKACVKRWKNVSWSQRSIVYVGLLIVNVTLAGTGPKNLRALGCQPGPGYPYPRGNGPHGHTPKWPNQKKKNRENRQHMDLKPDLFG